MRKFEVSIQWEATIEAEDEGMALIEADSQFSLMNEARVTEIEPEGAEDDEAVS